MDAELAFQDGKDIYDASLNRAAEIVALMPISHRKTLLEPIEKGLIDSQSVFYLIDDKSNDQVPICAEDFVRLVSNYPSNENNTEFKSRNCSSSAEG